MASRMVQKRPLSNGILDGRGRRIPWALVTEWDSTSPRVVCPYCQERHRHGVGTLPLTGHNRGGDINNVDSRGRTPLMEAALWGRLRAVDYLLEHGADAGAKDVKGRSAYYFARPLARTARMRQEFSRWYRESAKIG